MLAAIAFLLIWIIIYGSLHAYVLWKANHLFRSWNGCLWILAALCVFMVFAPILIHVLDRRGILHWAQPLAMAGYFWMGIILWLFFYLLLMDIWNGGAHIAGFFQPGARAAQLAPRLSMALAFGATLATCVFGMWNAANIKLHTYRIPLASLAPGTEPIRIAQISDVHVGLIVRSGRMRKILRVVEEAKPHVLVCTGDMTDASYHAMKEVTDVLAPVRPPLGKYAVLGNHEHYAGLGHSMAFLQECGFEVLRNATADVGSSLRLVGVDDPASGTGMQALRQAEQDLLKKSEPKGRATVLLKHRPVVNGESEGLFDLQLSGHSHGGQILPMGYFVLLQYPMGPKLKHLGESKGAFYVSSGTGTWGPPMRLFAPAEVALFILEPTGIADSEPVQGPPKEIEPQSARP